MMNTKFLTAGLVFFVVFLITLLISSQKTYSIPVPPITFSDATPPTGANVVIIYNTNWSQDQDSNGAQDSLQIAQAYRTARSVPADQLCGVPAPYGAQSGELLTMEQYLPFKNDILNCLQNFNDRDIRYLVIVKGIPLRVHLNDPYYVPESSNDIDYFAIDADLVYGSGDHPVSNIGIHTFTNYHGVDVPGYTLRHRFKPNWYTGTWNSTYPNVLLPMRYLVTRLDAPQLSTVLSIINKSLHPVNLSDAVAILDGDQRNDAMDYAVNYLTNQGANIWPDPWVDTTDPVTTAPMPVWAYIGHGKYADTSIGELIFEKANGAIYSTYESFNGTSFRTSVPADQYSPWQQTWCSQWLEAGGTACIANAQEPMSSGIAIESLFLPALFAGYPLADAAYMGLIHADWVNVVIGDPLMTFPNDVDVTAPLPPTNFTGTRGLYQNDLQWTASISDDVTAYQIYRSFTTISDITAPGVSLIATLQPNINTYNDSPLIGLRGYYYALRAVDGQNNYSNLAYTGMTVPLASQPSLTTQATNTSTVQVIWSPAPNSHTLNFSLYRSLNPFSQITEPGVQYIYTGSSSTLSYLDTGLSANTTYYYGLKQRGFGLVAAPLAFSSLTTQAVSQPDITPPNVPTNFQTTPVSQRINLTWQPSNSNDVAHQYLYRSLLPISNIDSSVTQLSILTPTANSYSDLGLAPNTRYYYALRARDGAGNFSSFITVSATTPNAQLPADTTPPAPPGNLSTSYDQSINSVRLSWSLSSSSDVALYRLYRSTAYISNVSAPGVNFIATVTHPLASYINSEVMPATIYYYAIVAQDTNGNNSSIISSNGISIPMEDEPPANEPPIEPPADDAYNGQLVKGSSPDVYYINQNNQRYIFYNEDVYYSWYGDFSSVITIADSALLQHPLGGYVPFRPGTALVKTPDNSSVYAVTTNGILRHLPNENTALSLFGPTWNQNIKVLPSSVLAPPTYMFGSALASSGSELPNGYLAHRSTGEVYLIASGQKRWITSMDVFNLHRWHIGLIHTVPNQVIDNYSAGPLINQLEANLIDPSYHD